MVDEELVHTTNDDQQGQEDYHGRGHGEECGHQGHGRAHVNPLQPIVKHAYHLRPQRKRKAHSCCTY